MTPDVLLALLLAAAQAGGPGPGNCPPQGAGKTAKQQAFNVKVNRTDAPSDSDLDDTCDLDAMLETGPDQDRWSDSNGAELTGYVIAVQDGGAQSADCFSGRQIRLYLAANSTGMDPAHQVVVVVTARWGRAMAGNGVNWSLDALTKKYQGQFVRVRGWLLYDHRAAKSAMNTAQNAGPGITRATAWEICPMTSIKLESNAFDQ